MHRRTPMSSSCRVMPSVSSFGVTTTNQLIASWLRSTASTASKVLSFQDRSAGKSGQEIVAEVHTSFASLRTRRVS